MAKRYFGHVYDWRSVDEWAAMSRRPVFGAAAHPLQGTGAGKVALLHKIVEKVSGSFPIRKQTAPDCVSHGFALSVDIVACVDIIVHGQAEEWLSWTATEPIYGAMRHEIGRDRLGTGGGAFGSWGSRCVTEMGTIRRDKYGSIDLRRYSGRRANEWGSPGRGVPDELEPLMFEHKIRTTSLVTSYEDARDAIFNGYPVAVCSTQGFTSTRDSSGFARASGTWPHCMVFMGSDDTGRRPGLLCMNSWGPNWISGPKRHEQPDGSFWVDAEIADRMLRRNSDSYSLSQYDGYKAQTVNYYDI